MEKIENVTVYDAYSNPHFRINRKHGKFPCNLTFGFENEVVYDSSCCSDKFNDRVADFMFSNPYLYMKEEASNNGVEINSHPFNWNWFKAVTKDKEQNFIKEFSELRNPYYFRVSNKCGFHIHLSRKFFTNKHLTKMVKFFYEPSHTKFLYKISKRTKFSFEEWASNKIPEHEITTNYYWGETKTVPYTFEQIASFGSCKFENEVGEKCSILNLYPKKTIEIRMFKGTTNPTLFKAYLEFALAVSLFTRDTDYDKINLKNFKKFIRKDLKIYKNLNKLITTPQSLEV